MSSVTEDKLYEVKESHTLDDKNAAIKFVVQEFPHALETHDIGDIEKHLISNVNDFKTMNYVYVTNEENQLTGIISIKELFRQPKNTIVSTVMEKDIISVRPSYTKERVTYVALRHHLKDIPVVDDDHKLLGVIPYSTIYSLAYKEARDDLMKFAGFHHEGVVTEDIMAEPTLRAVKHRIPWLLLGLIGGLGVAGIIAGFEGTLAKNLILASFIPMVVYMSDAVGTQMEAYIIRDLALNPKMHFRPYFFKQFLIVTCINFIASSALFLVSFVLYRNLLISETLGISLGGAIYSSLTTGLFVPKLFNKLKQDPANASGPIGTIIQNILSVLIYFTVAALIL